VGGRLRPTIRFNGLFDGASTSSLRIFGLVVSGPATPILAEGTHWAVVWTTILTWLWTERKLARAVADLEFVRAIRIRLALEQACRPRVNAIPARAT
jgi:hypothetical protein